MDQKKLAIGKIDRSHVKQQKCSAFTQVFWMIAVKDDFSAILAKVLLILCKTGQVVEISFPGQNSFIF